MGATGRQVSLESSSGHLTVPGDAVDAEIVAIQPPGDERNGAAADEGIEHEAPGGRAGEKAGFHERFGKDGEVSFAEFRE